MLVAGALALDTISSAPALRLSGRNGRRWADLCLAWSADTLAGRDLTLSISEPELEELPGMVRLGFELESTLWRRKRVVLECRPARLEAYLELEGDGRLDEVRLFGGRFSGDRWGSGRFWSRPGFTELWNPEPTRAEWRPQPAASSAVIDVLGGSLPGQEHWFFTPAPFCYGLDGEGDGWLMAGLAAAPGENLFTGFAYEGLEEGFCFRLDYEGQTEVSGAWRSPRLLLWESNDPYAGLVEHRLLLQAAGCVPAARSEAPPAWWSRPIFCGWGAQCALGGSPFEKATQANYDSFLAALAAKGVEPGTVVIDDKWAVDYGRSLPDERAWPDLKGWIAGQHGRGRRVLLWWKAWDPEGLPPEQCVTDPAGRPLAADPSNPAYQDALRSLVRRLLGPDGLDADGLKIDFTARTPSGPGLRRHGREWGVELLHLLLATVHEEAHRVKPDALVMTHTPNPYFRDVSDMIRLNDIAREHPVLPQMRHRAAVAAAACPELLVDCDNWPMVDLAAWRDYVAVQRELGVPSLYYVDRIDTSGEPLVEADYELVRSIWAAESLTR